MFIVLPCRRERRSPAALAGETTGFCKAIRPFWIWYCVLVVVSAILMDAKLPDFGVSTDQTSIPPSLPTWIPPWAGIQSGGFRYVAHSYSLSAVVGGAISQAPTQRPASAQAVPLHQGLSTTRFPGNHAQVVMDSTTAGRVTLSK